MRRARAAALAAFASASGACFLAGYELGPRDGGPFAGPPDAELGADDAGTAPPTPDGASTDGDSSADEPACEPGVWCNYACNSGKPCNFTCRSGNQCIVRCSGPEACTGIICEDGASCAMFCNDLQAGGCNAACKASASASTTCPTAPQAWCGKCAELPPAETMAL